MLKEYCEISSSKLLDFLFFIFDVQHIIDFEHYIVLPLPLIPFYIWQEDQDNFKFLSCVQSISTQVFE
jgi:hypothetical protein